MRSRSVWAPKAPAKIAPGAVRNTRQISNPPRELLFFIHLESRRVDIAGIAIHPNEPWMKQMARNVTMEGCGILRVCRYLLLDRDTKFTESFRAIIASGQVEPLALPARSPNLKEWAA